MTLILPPGFKSQSRPLINQPTSELLRELQERQLLAELTGKIAMPKDEALKTLEAVDQMRQQQLINMAQQLGVAISKTPFALVGNALEPNPLDPNIQDEILILSILLCMHPSHIEALNKQQKAVAVSSSELIP